MTTGSYEDAIKAFTNAYEIQKLPQALYQRARVFFSKYFIIPYKSVILHYHS